MIRQIVLAVCLLALLSVIAGPSAYADVLYTNRGAFLAATSGQTNIDFDGIAPTNSYVDYGNGPLTLSGVTFTGNGSMFVIDPGYYGSTYSGSGYLNSDYAVPDIITAALPSGVTAVGFDFGGLLGNGANGPFVITLSDGSTTTQTACCTQFDGAGLSFVGYTSGSDISSVTIQMPDAQGYNMIDNFVFAQSSVPEPSCLLLFAAGLGTLVAGRIRRNRAS